MHPTDTTSPQAPLLEARELRKYFPLRGGWFGREREQVKAVNGVSLTVQRGEILGLVGESGCGKSTLGRNLLYLQQPTAGEVYVDGRALGGLSRAEMMACRRDLQIVFQDPYASLSPRRTVAQIIREPLEVHRVGNQAERRERVEQLLQVVGLRSNVLNRYPHEFSGGQRQRIGIARALALSPRLIVADEPVSALDVSVQSQVLNLIAQLRDERGIAFVFISHDLAVIQHISDTVAVMYLGKIVEQAPVQALFQGPRHPYTQALLAAVPEPDPGRRRPTPVLHGEVPSPVRPPSGCAFHPRCPHAVSRCRAETPALRWLAAEHRVACHLA